MLATTILVDERPVCVVRPMDRKDLERFMRNGRRYLLADNDAGRITYREAEPAEAERWSRAFALHRAWSSSDEGFFGIPL
jgi:hypothetical protein